MSLFKGHKKRDNKVSDAELHAVEHSVLGGRRILWAGLAAVSTEMSLHVLAYNLKRMMNIFGVKSLIKAMQA